MDRSAPSSTASGTPDPDGLVGDAGPPFDPSGEQPPPPVQLDPDALAGGDRWSAQRVRALLEGKGELLHQAVAVDPDSTEWRYTAADLRTIAPPLARILNRYDVTRAAAAGGDELAVAVGFAGYGMRSWSERRAALRLLAEDEPEPPYVSPAAAPAPADPEPAPTDDGLPPDDALPPIASPRR